MFYKMLHVEDFIEDYCLLNNKTSTRDGGERGNLTFVFNPQTPDPKFNPNLLKKNRKYYVCKGGELFSNGGEKPQELPQPTITIDFNIIFFKTL